MGFFRKKSSIQSDQGSTPTREHQIRRDELVSMMKSGNQKAMPELWNLFFQLEQVHMVARGSMPNPTPFIANIEGQGMIAVFTSSDRAVQFSSLQGTAYEGTEAHSVLSNPMIPFIGYAARLYQSGVYGIIVDEGVGGGYYAPITNLIGMFEQARGDIPLVVVPAGQGEFDHRTQLMRSATNDQERVSATQKLWARYFLIPHWHLLVDQESNETLRAPTPDGRDRILMCSDPWNLERAKESLGAASGRSITSTTVETKSLIDHIESIGDDNILVLINPAGSSNQTDLNAIRGIWNDMPSVRAAHGVS